MKNLLFLDLELNQPSNKIIQIGWVITDRALNALYASCLTINCEEAIDPFITNLTGITQGNVNTGLPLNLAYEQLRSSVAQFPGTFRNPVTWGGGDSELLRTQLGLDVEDPNWLFGRRWIDAKTLFISWRLANGRHPSGSLSKALKNFGMEFVGTPHNALDDAYNTMLIYKRLLETFKNV